MAELKSRIHLIIQERMVDVSRKNLDRHEFPAVTKHQLLSCLLYFEDLFIEHNTNPNLKCSITSKIKLTQRFKVI